MTHVKSSHSIRNYTKLPDKKKKKPYDLRISNVWSTEIILNLEAREYFSQPDMTKSVKFQTLLAILNLYLVEFLLRTEFLATRFQGRLLCLSH